MSVDKLKRDVIDAAQKYKSRYKQLLNIDDLDTFKRLMSVYSHLDGIGGGGNLQQVTDEGNTTTNTIETAGTKSDYFLLDTTATPTLQQGMLFWDEDRSTVGLQMNGVDAHLGQDNFWYVKNQTGSTIPKGKAVMAVGTLGASGRILIDEMVANGSVSAKYLLGITAESIADGADGFVMNIGKIRQLDTSAWPDGTVLYCDASTPGNLTATAPSSPNLALPVAFVVHSAANGIIAVRIQTLDENAFATPTLDQVTTAGNTTANGISIGSLAVDTNLIYTDAVNNRVGIGTISPNGDLHVVSGAYHPLRISGRYTYFSNNNLVTDAGAGYGFLYNYGYAGYLRLGNDAISSTDIRLGGSGNGLFPHAIVFRNSNSESMRIASTGNVLIGTTTDSGYKLDVNGTARVSGDFTVDTDTLFVDSVNNRVGIGTTTPTVQLESVKYFTGFETQIQARNSYSGSDSFAGIGFSVSAATFVNNTGYVGVLRTLFSGGDVPALIFGVNGSIQSGNLTHEKMRIYGNTGNVLINTTTDAGYKLDVNGTARIQNQLTTSGSITASSALAQGVYFNNTLVAAANNDVLVGLDINPTFTNGAFTGVSNLALRTQSGNVIFNGGNVGIGKSSGLYYPLTIERNTTSNYLELKSTASAGLYATGKGLLAFDSSQNFSIYTGGIVERMRVTSTGNVLIGTTTDAGYKLDVNGKGRVGNSGDYGDVFVIRAPGTGWSFDHQYLKIGAIFKLGLDRVQLRVNNGSAYVGNDGDSGNASLVIMGGYNGAGTDFAPVIFGSGRNASLARETMRVDNQNQRVGIGTTTPSYKLEVNGKVSAQLTNATHSDQVYYNSATGELTYGALPASAAITSTQISNWDTAYGWGDHSTQGYITGTTGFTGTFTVPTNPPGQQNLDIQNGLIVNVF